MVQGNELPAVMMAEFIDGMILSSDSSSSDPELEG